jgi:hypothetical protein
LPAAEAVPLSEPLELKVTPGGSCPLATVHVYGDVPPDAANAAEYAEFTVPLGKEVVVTCRLGAEEGALAITNW